MHSICVSECMFMYRPSLKKSDVQAFKVCVAYSYLLFSLSIKTFGEYSTHVKSIYILCVRVELIPKCKYTHTHTCLK
jgi:hypothetical protein